MTILPRLRVQEGEGVGNQLFIGFPDLKDFPKTYLDADSAAGDSSLTCDGTDFSVSQFIVLGDPGNEKTEIVQIHSSTVPTSTTVTLAGTATFAHNRGDLVRFIPYDKIRAYYSTDNVTFTQETPDFAIRADASETFHVRTGDNSTYYYYVYFVNSSTSLLSSASDTIAASGFADNTIGSVKQRALRQMGEKISDFITNQDLDDWLQEGRRWLDQNPAVFRWSFRTKYDQTHQALSGQWKIPIPTDLRDRFSPKNVLSIRCINQNRPVIYQDKVRFNQNYLNVSHSTVATQAASGATSLVLTSTHDFDSAGAITLSNNSVGDGLISITYTGNNKTTNTLTGIPASGTGSINRTVLVGTEAWQRAVYGLPTAYTVGSDGNWYFDVPLKIDWDGMDYKYDYYTQIPAITSDNQAFDEPFYDLYVSWLKWKIKYKKSNGRIDRDGDPDYKDWIQGSANVIGQEFPGQRIFFIPDIEGFLSATE